MIRWQRTLRKITGRETVGSKTRQRHRSRQSIDASEWYPTLSLVSVMDAAVDWLDKFWDPREGGFRPRIGEERSGTWTTAGLLWALSSAGQSFQLDHMKQALDFLVDEQEKTGGGLPSRSPNDPRVVTDVTSFFTMALAKAYEEVGNEHYRQALRMACRWLLDNRNPSTEKGRGWGHWGARDRSWTISTAFAMLALVAGQRALHDEEIAAEVEATLDDVAQWLQSIGAGSWGLFEGDSPKCAPTALAILALLEKGLDRDGVAEGVDFLKRSIRMDGSWPDSLETHEETRVIIRFATPFCIMALVRAGEPIVKHGERNHIQAGLASLLRSFKHGELQYEDCTGVPWPTRDGLLALADLSRRWGPQQLLQLLENNVQLGEETRALRCELDRQQEVLERRYRRRVSVLKALVVILMLAIGTLTTWFVSVQYSLTLEQSVSIYAVYLAVWGVLVGLIAVV